MKPIYILNFVLSVLLISIPQYEPIPVVEQKTVVILQSSLKMN